MTTHSKISSNPPAAIEPAIEFTPAARAQIVRKLARLRTHTPDAFLRVGVKGGGCSGLSYFMEPDSECDEGDRAWLDPDGLRVVVDERSLEFVRGMTVDYDLRNLMEGGFVYRNPNAERTCGCGTSFTPRTAPQ